MANQLESLDDITAKPQIKLNSNGAGTIIRDIATQLQSLNGMTSTVHINTVQTVTNVDGTAKTYTTTTAKTSAKEASAANVSKVTKLSGATRSVFASGTAYAFGTAYAEGTTGYDDWESYRHSMDAWANGTPHDWALPSSQDALVNEFAPGAPESIVKFCDFIQ